MRGISFLLLMLVTTSAAWGGIIGNGVDVELRADRGGELATYHHSAMHGKRKYYAEAVKGECYSLVIRNRLDRRIGVVIAVDGRNIISGKKSWLKNTERMYILGPYETYTYEGWRTGSDKVNRFYFTDAGDSYAAAFKDVSAMGLIAVAVYPEAIRYQVPEYDSPQELSPGRSERATGAAPSAKAQDSAGTGYGNEIYSPSKVVAFEPEPTCLETILIKYEWRETLCRLGVIPCQKPCKPKNRLWDEDGYAPPPPGRS